MLLTFLTLAALLALFPIGDDNTDRRSTPFVTYALIAANIAVFFLLQGAGANDQFTYGYSVIPREITTGRDIIATVSTELGRIPEAPGPSPIYLTILSAMFMHGSLMHLFGNMLYLWIFGDNIEDALGHFKFLAFYLICGLIATAAQVMAGPNSLIPNLGASGAIAGVLGGYLLMYPSRTVRVLIGWVGIINMPAVIVIGLWGALQIFNSVGAVAKTEQTGGVAYMAHVGGFFAGLVLVKLFANREKVVQHAETVNYPVHVWDDRR